MDHFIGKEMNELTIMKVAINQIQWLMVSVECPKSLGVINQKGNVA